MQAAKPEVFSYSVQKWRDALEDAPIGAWRAVCVGAKRFSFDEEREKRERNIRSLYRPAPRRFDGKYEPHTTGELRVAEWECSLPTYRGSK